ncbi:MAG: DUF2889 domain-containing protein [Actinobacteria bacterium]|nr:DUF2889 domain-containing protein [Actinomycetota bacterium]
MAPPHPNAGAYRRRIRIVAPVEGQVVADLEDDFHRFRVELHHDGRQVTSCTGQALRFPWTECPGAVERLPELAGAPLTPRGTDVAGHADPHLHCTHLFDLAGLAVAHAAGGRYERQYDAVIPDRDAALVTHARLFRDGELVMAWDLEGLEIKAPLLYEGVMLRGGFMRWANSHLDPEGAEAAAVLRRACEISWGRQTPWDNLERALDIGDFMLGVCHTFRAGVAEVALRVKGTVRDFTDRPGDLLGS